MKLSPELHWLALTVVATILMWVPYVLARVTARGLFAAMGNPGVNDPPEPPWADRARRAHANAVENLAVFAPLVLIAAQLGVTTPATVLAAKTYFWARIAHYLIYAAGIPVARTLAFVVGVAATLTFAAAILL